MSKNIPRLAEIGEKLIIKMLEGSPPILDQIIDLCEIESRKAYPDGEHLDQLIQNMAKVIQGYQEHRKYAVEGGLDITRYDEIFKKSLAKSNKFVPQIYM